MFRMKNMALVVALMGTFVQGSHSANAFKVPTTSKKSIGRTKSPKPTRDRKNTGSGVAKAKRAKRKAKNR